MNSRTAVDTNAVFWRSRTGILAVALTAVIVVAVSFAPYPTSVPISGGCAAASYGAIVDAAPPNSAISFCERGNADRLSIATTVPMHCRYVHLSYIGYPHTAGEKIALRSTSGEEFRLEFPTAGEIWRSRIIVVPKRFAREGYSIVAEDNSAEAFGWLGLGNVYPSLLPFDLQRAGQIVLILLGLHLVATTGLAAAGSKRPLPVAVIYSSIGAGLAGYCAFWAFFLKPELGYAFCGAAWMAFISYVARAKPSARDLARASDLVLPVTLYALLVAWVAFYPFADVFTEAAGERFFTLRRMFLCPMEVSGSC